MFDGIFSQRIGPFNYSARAMTPEEIAAHNAQNWYRYDQQAYYNLQADILTDILRARAKRAAAKVFAVRRRFDMAPYFDDTQ